MTDRGVATHTMKGIQRVLVRLLLYSTVKEGLDNNVLLGCVDRGRHGDGILQNLLGDEGDVEGRESGDGGGKGVGWELVWGGPVGVHQLVL